MAEYYDDFRKAQNLDDLKIMLNKFFEWFFVNLDSLNITSITTEQTKVKSKDGETQIIGTMLVMRDTTTLRLEMGLNKATGNFEFNLYDADGNATVSLSDLGQLLLGGKPLIEMYDNQTPAVLRLKMGYDGGTDSFVFKLYDASGTNNIDLDGAGKGIITGGTIRTAASGKRIELSGNSFKTYNDMNELEGLTTGEATGGQYGDMYLYNADTPVAILYNTVVDGYQLYPLNGYSFFLGKTGETTSLYGDISIVDKIGFFGATPINKVTVNTLSTPTVSGGLDTVDLSSLNSAISSLTAKVNELINSRKTYGDA